MSKFQNVTGYRGGPTLCPHCKGTDIREASVGPDRNFNVTRTWFCRTCWWDTSVKLHDDVAERTAHGAAGL